MIYDAFPTLDHLGLSFPPTDLSWIVCTADFEIGEKSGWNSLSVERNSKVNIIII